MHAHIGEWACLSMHAHMHWWQGIVEGLRDLEVRHTKVQIQCDCSPAVQSRVSVKWGWQDLHRELIVRLQREPKSQHNSLHVNSPRQRWFEHWMLCCSWKALSLLEPYVHIYLFSGGWGAFWLSPPPCTLSPLHSYLGRSDRVRGDAQGRSHLC